MNYLLLEGQWWWFNTKNNKMVIQEWWLRQLVSLQRANFFDFAPKYRQKIKEWFGFTSDLAFLVRALSGKIKIEWKESKYWFSFVINHTRICTYTRKAYHKKFKRISVRAKMTVILQFTAKQLRLGRVKCEFIFVGSVQNKLSDLIFLVRTFKINFIWKIIYKNGTIGEESTQWLYEIQSFKNVTKHKQKTKQCSPCCFPE